MPKCEAPIALIRKVASDDLTREDREKQLAREERQVMNRAVAAKGPGALVGALGGAALGAYAGHKGIPIGQNKLHLNPALSGYGGAMIGGLAGGALGGGQKGRDAETRLDEIAKERSMLAAMAPGSTGDLNEENLDRDGYEQARADAAAASLKASRLAKPIGTGALIGTGLGAVGGALMGPKVYSNTGLPAPAARLALGGHGAMAGSILGMLGGLAAMGGKGRKQLDRSVGEYTKARDQRDRIWAGASELADQVPVDEIRKAASAEAFSSLTSPREVFPDTESVIYAAKLAAVEDQQLFKTASMISYLSNPVEVDQDAVFATYESLGGKYKRAFGAPMFNTQQMTGSPALSGGMSRRASTPMPTAQQAQPVKSPATSSPRQQAQGMASTPSATSQSPSVSAVPAAAPAPAPSVSMG